MQDKRPTFHRANIESILFSPCKHILFFSLCQSYLIKNACHSTTPIPQGNTIKCHSEATPKNLVVATTRGCLIYPHFTTRMSNAPTSKNACCLCRMDCRLACHSDVAVPRIILRLTRSIASTARTTTPLSVRTVGLLVILSVSEESRRSTRPRTSNTST